MGLSNEQHRKYCEDNKGKRARVQSIKIATQDLNLQYNLIKKYHVWKQHIYRKIWGKLL